MSRRDAAGDVVVGGEPRVDLLPPEVEEAKRVRRIRRGMLTLLVVGVLIGGAAFGGVSYVALLAQQRLDEENARTAALLAQQQEFIVVRTTADRVATAEAALIVGASTEIDMAAFLSTVTALLPAGASISTANADAASPFDAYAQAAVPLQPQRIATFNFALRTATLTDVREWLLRLQTVEGFTDALPGSVAAQEDGSYLTSITLHVDAGALSNRFVVEADETDTDEATEDASGTDIGSATEGADQ